MDFGQHSLHCHATYVLDGRSGSTAAARAHARDFLDRRRPALSAAQAEDVVLVVSELVANAVRHAPGPCALDLADEGSHLAVAVSDTSPTAPVPRTADTSTGTGGFGWNLVRTLAHAVQVTLHRTGGKTITALLPQLALSFALHPA
ncbi:ATP-binding protein [Streptacidiphilus sp. N1-12]|uniref:ATP-binding protein n=2 Tax=Streptacidiphilus alkalitolerans TaxID=3342712 RepID=A0ABV6VIM0_9ACTN